MFYVYVHKRKNTNEIFYVGKGSKDRMYSYKNRNLIWERIVNKDGGFDVEIYKDNLTEDEAFDIEINLIKKIGLENLSNICEGGVGGDTLSQHPNIKDIGKKISHANSGEKNGNYGKGYYYWWVKKYGEDVANEMQKEMTERVTKQLRGRKYDPRPHLAGDNNPAKKEDVRRKLSNFAKNRIRKKVTCQICCKEFPDTHIKRHLGGNNCKK